MKVKGRYLVIALIMVMTLGVFFKPDSVQAATKKISTPTVTWNTTHPGKVVWSKNIYAKSYTVLLYAGSKLICSKTVKGKNYTDFCLQLAKNYKKANIIVRVRANAKKGYKSSNWGRTKKTFLNTKFKISSRYNDCKNNWERFKVAIRYNHPTYLKYLPTSAIVTPTPTPTPVPATTSTTTYELREVASLLPSNSNILKAWEEMKFTLVVDPTVNYSGNFSVTREKGGVITLRKLDENIYHELGHFLSFMANGKAQKESFKNIFIEEFPEFEGRNRRYAGQNSNEYFAEAFYEYIFNPKRLKTNCPKTYATLEESIAEIDEARIKLYKMVYAVK